MSELWAFLCHVFNTLGFVLVWVMCLVGLLLSCLSISGTWLVVGATFLSAILTGPGHFPGLGSFLLVTYVAILVEVADTVAGVWGVRRRGGSNWAGFVSLVGGLIGLFIGSMIPIPVIGSLLGMMAGSFGLVYLVEKNRLQRSAPALHIALGAVMARVFVVLLKVSATLGMMAYLIIGLLRT